MKKEINKKARMTNQRRVILKELKKLTSHPTACELYQIVRKRLPRISLGTIYRNLDLLVKTGMVKRLDYGACQAKFDAHTEKHHHIHCIRCGKVGDILNLPGADVSKGATKLTSYKVLGHKLVFSGICPKCVNFIKSENNLQNVKNYRRKINVH